MFAAHIDDEVGAVRAVRQVRHGQRPEHFTLITWSMIQNGLKFNPVAK